MGRKKKLEEQRLWGLSGKDNIGERDREGTEEIRCPPQMVVDLPVA